MSFMLNTIILSFVHYYIPYDKINNLNDWLEKNNIEALLLYNS